MKKHHKTTLLHHLNYTIYCKTENRLHVTKRNKGKLKLDFTMLVFNNNIAYTTKTNITLMKFLYRTQQRASNNDFKQLAFTSVIISLDFSQPIKI